MKKRCLNCGTCCDNDANFCPNCGGNVFEEIESEQNVVINEGLYSEATEQPDIFGESNPSGYGENNPNGYVYQNQIPPVMPNDMNQPNVDLNGNPIPQAPIPPKNNKKTVIIVVIILVVLGIFASTIGIAVYYSNKEKEREKAESEIWAQFNSLPSIDFGFSEMEPPSSNPALDIFSSDSTSQNSYGSSSSNNHSSGSGNYKKGTFSNNCYINEWANIKLPLPDGWTDCTDTIEQSNNFLIDDQFMCIGLNGDNLIFNTLNTSLPANSMLDTLTTRAEIDFKDVMDGTTATHGSKYDLTIAGEKFRCVTLRIDRDGTTIGYQVHCIRVIGSKSFYICITSFTGEVEAKQLTSYITKAK